MTKDQLNKKAMTLLLENIINNDSDINAYNYIESDNQGIINASIDYVLMITKFTGDTDDHACVRKIADLYDNTDDGEAADYIKTVYGKQLKQLGVKKFN